MDSSTDLRCTKCGRVFPSVYWFELPGICVQCFPRLTPSEIEQSRLVIETPVAPLPTFPSVLQAFVILPLLIIAIALPTTILIKSSGSSVPVGIRFMLLYLGSWGLPALAFVGIAASRGRFQESMFGWTIPRLSLVVQFAFISLVIVCASSVIGVLVFRPNVSSSYGVPHDLFAAMTRVIVAPLCEETVFRGVVLHSFLKRHTARKAIVLSSVLFALLHVTPARMLLALCSGLFLGWIYSHYLSIVPTMGIHALVNAAGFLATLLTPQPSISYGATLNSFELAVAIVASIGILVAAGFWIKLLDRRISTPRVAPS
jgi:membrane protease YdiL (CAAX protease family)